jgi:hypothetical protein
MKSTDSIQLRYRPFKVKYLTPGSVRGSRIKITDLRREESITIEYDDGKGQAIDQAAEYLTKRGIKIEAMSMAFKDSEILLLTQDFKTAMKG